MPMGPIIQKQNAMPTQANIFRVPTADTTAPEPNRPAWSDPHERTIWRLANTSHRDSHADSPNADTGNATRLHIIHFHRNRLLPPHSRTPQWNVARPRPNPPL